MTALDFKVRGFLFSGISAGIKKDGRRDLGLIYSEVPAQAAGLFTTNLVQAAPVIGPSCPPRPTAGAAQPRLG